MGNGDKLSPIDYMVWRDQVNVLDQPRIFKLLSKGPRLEGYLTQLHKATKLDFASWGGFAQNYADRRIPFEDAAYTPYWERAQAESLSIPTFAATDDGPFLPGAAVKGVLRTAFVFANVKPAAIREVGRKMTGERPLAPSGGAHRASDRGLRRIGPDARRFPSRIPHTSRAMPIGFTCCGSPRCTARGPQQYALGWKQTGRGAADGKRPEDGTPAFAEMAAPGNDVRRPLARE